MGNNPLFQMCRQISPMVSTFKLKASLHSFSSFSKQETLETRIYTIFQQQMLSKHLL